MRSPWWLVAAIREGYAAAPAAGLLSYAEMLRTCDREGLTTDDFEPVRAPGSSLPRWHRRAPV